MGTERVRMEWGQREEGSDGMEWGQRVRMEWGQRG